MEPGGAGGEQDAAASCSPGGGGSEQGGAGEPRSQEGELGLLERLSRNDVQTLEVGGGPLQEVLLAWLLLLNCP